MNPFIIKQIRKKPGRIKLTPETAPIHHIFGSKIIIFFCRPKINFLKYHHHSSCRVYYCVYYLSFLYIFFFRPFSLELGLMVEKGKLEFQARSDRGASTLPDTLSNNLTGETRKISARLLGTRSVVVISKKRGNPGRWYKSRSTNQRGIIIMIVYFEQAQETKKKMDILFYIYIQKKKKRKKRRKTKEKSRKKEQKNHNAIDKHFTNSS